MRFVLGLFGNFPYRNVIYPFQLSNLSSKYKWHLLFVFFKKLLHFLLFDFKLSSIMHEFSFLRGKLLFLVVQISLRLFLSKLDVLEFLFSHIFFFLNLKNLNKLFTKFSNSRYLFSYSSLILRDSDSTCLSLISTFCFRSMRSCNFLSSC